jgi:hypothetical protein
MNDKGLHMIAGLVISFVLGWLYGSLIGLAVAIVAGIAKEVWDYCGHGTPDFKDALTTAEGGVIGCIILAVYQAV